MLNCFNIARKTTESQIALPSFLAISDKLISASLKDHGIYPIQYVLKTFYRDGFASQFLIPNFTFWSSIFIIIAKVIRLNPIHFFLNTHTNLARVPLGSLWYAGEELIDGCNDIWNIFFNCTQSFLQGLVREQEVRKLVYMLYFPY